MRATRSLFPALAVLATLGGAATAQLHYELQDLVKLAHVVFHGRVIDVRTEAEPGKDIAWTHVTFAVERALIDRTTPAVKDSIELVFAGGQVGDRVAELSGIPRFTPGEEVLVFALHDGARYLSPVVGETQGVLRVVRDTLDGTGYPLLPGGIGIAAVIKGSFVPADRVVEIAGGVPVWREPAVMPGVARPPAPEPVTGSGAGAARVSIALEPNRPQHLADLETVCRGIQALGALPVTRKPVEADAGPTDQPGTKSQKEEHR